LQPKSNLWFSLMLPNAASSSWQKKKKKCTVDGPMDDLETTKVNKKGIEVNLGNLETKKESLGKWQVPFFPKI